MSKNIFLFADIANQDPGQAFGVVGENEYNIQSIHTRNLNLSVVAVVGGYLYAVEDSSDPNNYLTLILKPNQQELTEIYGYEIEYMIYKRVLKSSIVDTSGTNNQYPIKLAATNDLTGHLWKISDDQNNQNGGSGVPGSNMLGLHLTSTDVPSEKPIDWLFRFDENFNPIPVKAGDILGEFHTEFAFEIYIKRFLEDHTVGEARNFENKVEIDPQEPALKQKHDREKILNYLDPAVLYGEYCKDGLEVTVRTSTTDSVFKGKNNIYDNVLARFHNKDVIYVDIRNDNNYSYNFYEQFDIGGDNFQYEFEGHNKFEGSYNRASWPIHTIRTSNVVNLDNFTGNEINLKIALVHYKDVSANIFIKNREERIKRRESERRRRRSRPRELDELNEWTENFGIDVYFVSGIGLLSSYIKILYNKTELSDNAPAEYMPKMGFIDGVIPLFKVPDLRPHETSKFFKTGYERFIFFEAGDDPNIPFSFYGVFKFGYSYESTNNRFVIIAFAEEVYLLGKKHEATGLLSTLGFENSSNEVEDEISTNVPLKIFHQELDKNSGKIRLLRYDPANFESTDLPTFNLQVNFISFLFAKEEYDAIIQAVDNSNLNSEFHLPLFNLPDNGYAEHRHNYPTDSNNLPRFINYYEILPQIKGLHNNSNPISVDITTWPFPDSSLHSVNKLVFSTNEAAKRDSNSNLMTKGGSEEHLNPSNHYFILPDEIFDNTHPEYIEVNELKKGIRETYAAIPNAVTALWAKYVHENIKVAIGISKQENNGVIELFGQEDLEQARGFPYEIVYKHTFRTGEGFPDADGFMSTTQIVHNAKLIEPKAFGNFAGVYRKSPFLIYKERDGDFDTVEKRFELVKLFLGEELEIRITNKRIKDDYERFVNYEIKNNHSGDPPILNLNDSDILHYFKYIFEKNNGKYRLPTEIATIYNPRLNYDRPIFGEVKKLMDDELFDLHNKLITIISGGPEDLMDLELDDKVGPFYFYGKDRDSPQPNSAILDANNPYKEFNPSNFEGVTTYKDYLEQIRNVIRETTFYVELKPDEKGNEVLLTVGDNLPTEYEKYHEPFHTHVNILINKDKVNSKFDSSVRGKVKQIYIADILAHEIGHCLVPLFDGLKNYFFRYTENAHKESGQKSDNFPKYPYYFGPGHSRGSYTGNKSCNLGNMVELRLNNYYEDILMSVNLYESREKVRLQMHIYIADGENLPDLTNRPDQEDHGYCFNNMDPL